MGQVIYISVSGQGDGGKDLKLRWVPVWAPVGQGKQLAIVQEIGEREVNEVSVIILII